MTPASEFPNLLELALGEIQNSTNDLMHRHRLDLFDTWGLDVTNSRLVFGRSDGTSLAAMVQVLGRYEPDAGVWGWAWADPTLPRSVLHAAASARGFGVANEIAVLTDEQPKVDEPTAWRLAAFAAKLVGWPGIYRGPTKAGFLFLAIQVPPS